MTFTDEDFTRLDMPLHAADDAYVKALWRYRRQVLHAFCEAVREHAPQVAKVRLTSDVDWRWVIDTYLDSEGEEIDPEEGGFADFAEAMGDIFTGRIDEMPDWRGDAEIDVATETFADTEGGSWFDTQEEER